MDDERESARLDDDDDDHIVQEISLGCYDVDCQAKPGRLKTVNSKYHF